LNGPASERRLSRQELWYGRDEEPPKREIVPAGQLTVELEGPQIRAVRAGDVEILRGVYMAVRDEEWGTVPGSVSGLELQRGEREFASSFELNHQQSRLSFDWKGRIEGDPSGTITFQFDGVAHTAFRYCRIGFCLLHPPPEYAGQNYHGRSPNGPVQGALPLAIGPQLFEDGLDWPLFDSVSELDVSLASGLQVHMLFEGDLFEIEDQRNWTDASFKTYCTPLKLGYPFDASPGQRFSQKVTIQVSGRPASTNAGADLPRVTFDIDGGRPMPPIGLGLPRAAERHSAAETGLLACAHPSHLRVDLDLARDGWIARLAAGADTAGALGCPLEVAAFAESDGQLNQLVTELATRPSARLLVFTRGEQVSNPEMTDHARDVCAESGLGLPVIGGTDGWFAELNRDRPVTSAIDGLVYSITPQVHAFDEASIAQSLEAQPDTVRTAIGFADGLPISVGPVTLRPRDPIETEPPSDDAGSLPFSVDPRQSSLFAAAWTVGSISALAQAGAASLTYYETVGCLGIIPGDGPLPPRELFAAAPPGGAYAVFHVFADVLELGPQTKVLRCEPRAPSELAALALRTDDRLRILIANLTPVPLTVMLDPVRAVEIGIRMLDETTALEALVDPLAYRERAATPLTSTELAAPLELAPFAVARLDGRVPGG
jgi:D-apionolactonase